jgi:hypothetical protein
MSKPGHAPGPDDWEKTYLPPGAHMEAIHVASDQWWLTYDSVSRVGPFAQLYEFVWALYRWQQTK